MELETIHLSTLLVTVIAILYADHLGFEYLRGKRVTIPLVTSNRLHTIVWIGLITMIASGVLLTLREWEELLTEPVFYVKMGFVLVLVMNALAIGKMSHLSSVHPFKELSPEVQKTLLVSGALSVSGWIGAAVIGMFFL
jgi:hypothetical protein